MSTPQQKPEMSTPLIVLFSILLFVGLPILPIYLWRKGRLSAAVGISLAVVWLAGYITIAALNPDDSDSKEASDKVTETTAAPKPEATETTTPTPTPTQTPTVAKTTVAPKPKPCADVATNVLKNPAYVFKCQFGKEWPLKVERGIVACRDKSGTSVQILTFLDPKGKEWALNGIASGSGYPKIDPIWKDDPDLPGAKIDISPLIDRAQKVCD